MPKFWDTPDVGVVREEDDGSATAFLGSRSWPVEMSEVLRDMSVREISEEEFAEALKEDKSVSGMFD